MIFMQFNDFYTKLKNYFTDFNVSLNLFIKNKKFIYILLYHRILPDYKYDIFGTKITISNFEKQINFISRNFEVLTLDNLDQNFEKNKPKICITFDDGYYDNYLYAMPILNKFNIKANFFVCSHYIGSNSPIWDEELIYILLNNDLRIKIEDKFYEFNNNKLFKVKEIINKLKKVNHLYRSEILNSIRSKAKNYSFQKEDSIMNWQNLSEMQSYGMKIGSHGCYHSSLQYLNEKDLDYEVFSSKEILSNNLSNYLNVFSIPFGSQNDFNQNIINKIKQAGYDKCLLNINGYLNLKQKQFEINRKIISDKKDIF